MSENHKNLAIKTNHGHITRDFSALERRALQESTNAFEYSKQACLDDSSITNNGVLRSRSRLDVKGSLIFDRQICPSRQISFMRKFSETFSFSWCHHLNMKCPHQILFETLAPGYRTILEAMAS